jgi:hypothetical protein
MSSVDPIVHDETFPQDALTAQDRVDSAKLQTQVSGIKQKLNELLAALDAFTRDDDTVADQHIRLRMLHPELVQALASASAWQAKPNVRLATATGVYHNPITGVPEGAAAPDGVTPTDGDRILVMTALYPHGQGIWVYNSGGAWTRPSDFDADNEAPWALVAVTDGVGNRSTIWLQVAPVVDLGVTAQSWSQVFGQVEYTAGAGIAIVYKQIAARTDTVTTDIAGGNIIVKDGGITAAKLASNAVTTDKIANFSVTNVKQGEMPALTIKGNNNAFSSTTPQDLTPNDVRLMLPAFVGDIGGAGTKGLVPAPAGGDAAAGKFLSANGGWEVVASSGTPLMGFKEPVRVVAFGNIALTGAQTIDGVACVAGDRVLVAGQTVGSENGLYVVAAGAWSRSTDADVTGEAVPGMLVRAIAGTVCGGTTWYLSNTTIPTLGTDALLFKPMRPDCWGRATLGAGASQFSDTALVNAFASSVDTMLGESGVSGRVVGTTTTRGAPFVSSANAGQFTIGAFGGGTYRLRASASKFWLNWGFTIWTGGFFSLFKNGSYVDGFRLTTDNAVYLDRMRFDKVLSLVAADTVECRFGLVTPTDNFWNPQVANWLFDIERIGD